MHTRLLASSLGALLAASAGPAAAQAQAQRDATLRYVCQDGARVSIRYDRPAGAAPNPLDPPRTASFAIAGKGGDQTLERRESGSGSVYGNDDYVWLEHQGTFTLTYLRGGQAVRRTTCRPAR